MQQKTKGKIPCAPQVAAVPHTGGGRRCERRTAQRNGETTVNGGDGSV